MHYMYSEVILDAGALISIDFFTTSLSMSSSVVFGPTSGNTSGR
jgi:hypothetical protein